MMLLNLYCPICLAEHIKIGKEKGIDYMSPVFSDVYEVLNNGIYKTHCAKGHEGIVVVDNLKFELLFDLGINAIIDGYYRESVASVTSALERFYEFFIKVIWRSNGLDYEIIDKNWKSISNQSERQLGAFITAYLSLAQGEVPLLKNEQVSFRNNVIHKGEIPSKEKTIEYADGVLQLIDKSLEVLRMNHEQFIQDVGNYMSPQYTPKSDDEVFLRINHLTVIDARHNFDEDDQRRNRNIVALMELIRNDRDIKRMRFTNDAKKIISQNEEIAAKMQLNANNSRNIENELQVIINPEASIEDCFFELDNLLNNYNMILNWVREEHPEICNNDIMTITLSNTQMLFQLYYLYLKAKVFKYMLDYNPTNIQVQQQYLQIEKELEDYHNGLSYAD